LQPGKDDKQNTDGEITEIKPELIASQQLVYPLRNRHLKALYYLKKALAGMHWSRGIKSAVISGSSLWIKT
jgi:hypothetical protein